ncbi:MAG: hypothetical protein AAF555_05815 [Verrucomicrobiota bacterium]
MRVIPVQWVAAPDGVTPACFFWRIEDHAALGESAEFERWWERVVAESVGCVLMHGHWWLGDPVAISFFKIGGLPKSDQLQPPLFFALDEEAVA